ncbi:MAG: type II toxin-antitoxin system RelE/ParE family toxin [Kaistella sp.]|nr:type II toxin-antitoxin system RelE/ParE family toxin [Kaistella sp.]
MKIKFAPEAEVEFRESVKFYETRQKGLGKRFADATKRSLYIIAENPLAAEVKYLEIRVATVKKFPFTIHYSVEEEFVLVVAIFHNSRNPANLLI